MSDKDIASPSPCRKQNLSQTCSLPQWTSNTKIPSMRQEKIMDKKRLTHNQSYKWGSGMSVNSGTIKELLMLCIYGTCLKRLINWTIAARRIYPNKWIMVNKIDFESAFWHCNSNPMLHPTPIQKPHPSLSLSHIWRIPLPKQVGSILQTNLQLINSKSIRQLMGPNQATLPIPKFSPATKNNGQQHTLWHGKRIDHEHWSKSKGNPQYIHQQHDPLHRGLSRNRQSSKMCSGRAPCNPCNRPAQTPKWTNPKRRDGGKT